MVDNSASWLPCWRVDLCCRRTGTLVSWRVDELSMTLVIHQKRLGGCSLWYVKEDDEMRYINVCQRLTIRQLNLPHEIKKQKNKENNMDMMALRINWKEQELGHIIENDVSKMTGCSSVRLFVTQWAVSKPPNISISSLFPFPPPQWGHWAKLLFVCPSVFLKSKFENSAFWSYCYYGTLIENPHASRRNRLSPWPILPPVPDGMLHSALRH